MYVVCDAYVWCVKCVWYVFDMCGVCVIYVCDVCVCDMCIWVVYDVCVICMMSMCDIYVCLCVWCVSMCNVILCVCIQVVCLLWCMLYVLCVLCICVHEPFVCVYACSMYVWCVYYMWFVLYMCVHESCKCACGGERTTLNINSWSRVSCCWHTCQGTWLTTFWGFTYVYPLLCCSSIGFIVLGFCNFFIYVLGIWNLILTYAYQSFNCLAISTSPLLLFLVTIFHNLDSVTSSWRRHVKTKIRYLVKNDVLRPWKLPSYVDKSPPTWKRKALLLYCEVLIPSLRIHHSLLSLPAAPWKLTYILFFSLALKIHCNE